MTRKPIDEQERFKLIRAHTVGFTEHDLIDPFVRKTSQKRFGADPVPHVPLVYTFVDDSDTEINEMADKNIPANAHKGHRTEHARRARLTEDENNRLNHLLDNVTGESMADWIARHIEIDENEEYKKPDKST